MTDWADEQVASIYRSQWDIARLPSDFAQALRAAKEAGRVEGLEQAAKWHVEQSTKALEELRRANDMSWETTALVARTTCGTHETSARAIRALIKPAQGEDR